MSKVSIVIPAYNEEESIPELTDWIMKVAEENDLAIEIIYIDDGSSDNTWQAITEMGEKYPGVKGIHFRRNYGKSAALNIGFGVTEGEVVITMDADLQDSPDEIPALVEMVLEEGYDVVSGWKKKRFDPITKTIPSKFFNWITRKMSKIKLHDFNCGLKAYRKEVVKSIEVYGEMHRYIPLIAKWAGFRKIGEKVVQHRARKYGITKFGLERFINGFLDLMSILFVSRFRKKPMHFFGTMGSLFFLAGGIISIWLIVEKIVHIARNMQVRDIVDQPLFYLALVAMIIGSQLFLTGFLAELVSRSAPDRDHYLVDKKLNLK